MKINKLFVGIVIGVFIGAIAIILAGKIYLNGNSAPIISLNETELTIEVLNDSIDFSNYIENVKDDQDDLSISDVIINTSNLDTATPGTYNVTYTILDNESKSTSASLIVHVVDNHVPVITLTGLEDQTIDIGSVYTEEGATCVDNYDEVCTVVIGGDTVDTSVLERYTITYDVTDSEGNIATTVLRTVRVEDISSPVITLNGDALIELLVGETYDEQGATFIDNYDTSGDISISGTVDTNTVGEYVLSYNLTDSSGNIALTVKRTIIVSRQPSRLLQFSTSEERNFSVSKYIPLPNNTELIMLKYSDYVKIIIMDEDNLVFEENYLPIHIFGDPVMNENNPTKIVYKIYTYDEETMIFYGYDITTEQSFIDILDLNTYTINTIDGDLTLVDESVDEETLLSTNSECFIIKPNGTDRGVYTFNDDLSLNLNFSLTHEYEHGAIVVNVGAEHIALIFDNYSISSSEAYVIDLTDHSYVLLGECHLESNRKVGTKIYVGNDFDNGLVYNKRVYYIDEVTGHDFRTYQVVYDDEFNLVVEFEDSTVNLVKENEKITNFYITENIEETCETIYHLYDDSFNLIKSLSFDVYYNATLDSDGNLYVLYEPSENNLRLSVFLLDGTEMTYGVNLNGLDGQFLDTYYSFSPVYRFENGTNYSYVTYVDNSWVEINLNVKYYRALYNQNTNTLTLTYPNGDFEDPMQYQQFEYAVYDFDTSSYVLTDVVPLTYIPDNYSEMIQLDDLTIFCITDNNTNIVSTIVLIDTENGTARFEEVQTLWAFSYVNDVILEDDTLIIIYQDSSYERDAITLDISNSSSDFVLDNGSYAQLDQREVYEDILNSLTLSIYGYYGESGYVKVTYGAQSFTLQERYIALLQLIVYDVEVTENDKVFLYDYFTCELISVTDGGIVVETGYFTDTGFYHLDGELYEKFEYLGLTIHDLITLDVILF